MLRAARSCNHTYKSFKFVKHHTFSRKLNRKLIVFCNSLLIRAQYTAKCCLFPERNNEVKFEAVKSRNPLFKKYEKKQTKV